VARDLAPIPALLATAGVHHHLIRAGQRNQCGLVVETGEAREVHHHCCLIGYGAGAVHPYLVFETLEQMIRDGDLAGLDPATAVRNYCKAAAKGVLKVMSKMGISTLQSYRGAQMFECVGLNEALVEKYFSGTPSRIGGADIDRVAAEIQRRHQNAFPAVKIPAGGHLDPGGKYKWRRDGEAHQYNPMTIARLQQAVRTKDEAAWAEFSALVNAQNRTEGLIRGLFEFKTPPAPVPLDEVEPADAIVRRFKTGAMSYGSISREAHETLAIAMNRIGAKSNSGEGGEDPDRYHPDENGDWRGSAIKQVASGRFGVTGAYLASATDLQIKMAQGAKPGEGGQLPAFKVYPWIAKTRHSTPYVGLISPPPHHDIYSIEDLAQLIHDLKNANPAARINVKLVSEVGVGTVAAGVAKGKADLILISGESGGTGASPQTSIRHAGLPWELGLSEAQQTLIMNGLRSRVVLECDGQLKTARDVAIACLLGAEEFGFGTIALVSLGCIMMRVCHLNTCPVGIATQDPELRKKFAGRPEHLINLMYFIAGDLRKIMAELGFRTIREMVGRVDRLEVGPAVDHWKAQGLDFSRILHKPELPDAVAATCSVQDQDHGLEHALDHRLIEICRPALEERQRVEFDLPIRNVQRTVGTMLSYEISRRYGLRGLPADTIVIQAAGSAGQSFCAFGAPGLTVHIQGDANDYFGKGLCGAQLTIRPPEGSTFKPEENIIIGNVAFYGATAGQAYICGVAGERFGVRNSGVRAVVEGVGDHGCEYMTGGRAVILGPTGRNFAAGMSGGIAYVYDPLQDFDLRCNLGMVDLDLLTEPDDINELKFGLQYIKHWLDLYSIYDPKRDNPYIDDYVTEPFEAAAYLQDKIELPFLIINLGLRFDYANANVSFHEDPLQQETEVKVEPRMQLSPRVGISHPVSENTKLHFSYGHFFQNPDYQYLFENKKYDIGVREPIFGQPNLDAERTISYEVGLAHQFSNNTALHLAIFYKDVTGYIGTHYYEFKDAYTNQYTAYTLYVNEDYANIKGFEANLDFRPSEYFSGGLTYSYQIAKGSASSETEQYPGTQESTKLYYLDFDKTHVVNASATYRIPSNGGPSIFNSKILGNTDYNLIFRASSGYPYTPSGRDVGFVERNSLRQPSTFTLDLELGKTFQIGSSLSLRAFAQIYNLFDTQNVVWVYRDTGDPEFTTVGGYSEEYMKDPSNYGPPRVILLGLGMRI